MISLQILLAISCHNFQLVSATHELNILLLQFSFKHQKKRIDFLLIQDKL